MCLTPSSIKNKSGKWVPIPCGSCAECLEWKRYQWYIRIKKEMLFWKKTYFITLTYEDHALIYGENEPTLYKPDLQNYIKRVRKALRGDLKYYSVGEYGTMFKRPHYHILILSKFDIENILREKWPKGHIKIDPVCDANIKYILKYHVLKTEGVEGSQPPFANISQGIGSSWVKSVKKSLNKGTETQILQQAQVYIDGKQKTLPRYLKMKLYPKIRQEAISKYNQIKLIEKKEKEVEETDKPNYWANKLTQIKAKNDNLKTKNKKSNTL